ncbi:hypothetical protein BDZ89DRAFT_1159709 [Hymenopellis radicata]|nr:hypothetical protein BDZ89DRAFT_1159709 [Hymenopellis radicata]
MVHEMMFGFHLPKEVVKHHPQFAISMGKNPEMTDTKTTSERERANFESLVCSGIISYLALQSKKIWPKARYEVTPSGFIMIALADNANADTVRVPSPEIIKSLQELLTPLEVTPKWLLAYISVESFMLKIHSLLVTVAILMTTNE